jgi:4-aminobutyrate aminotransferase-like enzyme
MRELQHEAALGVGEIRGLGGMSAFELIVPGTDNTPDADAAKALTAHAAELGLILLSCGVYANTIRVLVPLTVEDRELDEGLAILARALRAVRA